MLGSFFCKVSELWKFLFVITNVSSIVRHRNPGRQMPNTSLSERTNSNWPLSKPSALRKWRILCNELCGRHAFTPLALYLPQRIPFPLVKVKPSAGFLAWYAPRDGYFSQSALSPLFSQKGRADFPKASVCLIFHEGCLFEQTFRADVKLVWINFRRTLPCQTLVRIDASCQHNGLGAIFCFQLRMLCCCPSFTVFNLEAELSITLL